MFPGDWLACSTVCKVSRQDARLPSQPTARQQVRTCEASLGEQYSSWEAAEELQMHYLSSPYSPTCVVSAAEAACALLMQVAEHGSVPLTCYICLAP